MNLLVVGTNKATILEHLPDKYLLIDDGEMIDCLDLPARRKVVRFNISKNFFNPLKKINYHRAREFISILDSTFPEGDNTLTKASGLTFILKALLGRPKRLDRLISPPDRKASNGHIWAYDKLEEILLSPVLNAVLNRPTNFSFGGIILARLNRAELGDFDCFLLANLLISQYKGTVVVPDFGFYGHKEHASLIRQERLIAGVNFLDEVDRTMRNSLLLIEEKVGKHCTAEDAEVLANYAGYGPTKTGHSDFIRECIE